MKKNVILLLILINIGYAQKSDYIITYSLTRKINDFQFNAIGTLDLATGSKISLFKLSQYQNFFKKGDVTFIDKIGENIETFGKDDVCMEDKQYYFDYNKDSITSLLYNKNCKSKVLITDKINFPKWSIEKEFKNISGYKTQKATAFINDRTWTVYFTNDIKLSAAPWLLIGLPGVIIEAFENTNIYTFKLTKIEKNKDSIEKPFCEKKSSFKNFVKESIKQTTDETYFELSRMEGVIVETIDKNDFPLHETLDFIEKREQ